jgi:hypothetical protein
MPRTQGSSTRGAARKATGGLVSVLAGVLLALGPGAAEAITLDFETLADFEVVTTQFGGLGAIFSGATALTAGISLNELEFPPQSGVVAVFDEAGAVTVAADGALFGDIGGFFTYTTPLTLTAFAPDGALLGILTSAFASNLALSGDAGSSPNEFLGFTGLGPIARLVIAGDPAGGSFTLDDLRFEPAAAPVPVPASLVLLGIPLLLAAALLCRRRGEDRP